MSEVKTDKLSPRTASGTVTLGTSGDTFTIPSGVTLTNNGSSSGFDSGLASVQTFTSSGTWTRPSGITKVMVEVQGGGGGGKRKDTDPWGACGGSGAYAKKLIDVSSISSATVTVGSAGARGTSNNVDGGAGGASSWADGTNTVTANGGAGATDSRSAGPTASGGDINIGGGWSIVGQGTIGFDSVLGLGGRHLGYQANAIAPTGYGGSGGGSRSSASNTDGGAGIVIVTEYK